MREWSQAEGRGSGRPQPFTRVRTETQTKNRDPTDIPHGSEGSIGREQVVVGGGHIDRWSCPPAAPSRPPPPASPPSQMREAPTAVLPDRGNPHPHPHDLAP